MSIRLVFRTEKPEEIELVNRYWARAKDNSFVGTVKSMLPFGAATKPKELVALIQNLADAYYSGSKCSECGQHAYLRSRSDYKVVHFQRLCQYCDDAAMERIIEEPIDG